MICLFCFDDLELTLFDYGFVAGNELLVALQRSENEERERVANLSARKKSKVILVFF